jgi:hypothetical protein
MVDGTSTREIMDRRQVWGSSEAAAPFDNGSYNSYLYPGLAETTILRGTIVAALYLESTVNRISRVTVSILDLAPDGSRTTVGALPQVQVLAYAVGWYAFTVVNVNYTAAQGHALVMSVASAAGNQDVTLHYDSAAHNSRVELPVQNYINVDWARSYNSAYPAGAEATTFVVDTPVYVRVRASDPFGSYDITTATLTISGTNRTMTPVYGSGTDYKIYEAVYTPTLSGVYVYTVTVDEGSEGTISDTEQGQFYASTYGVSLYPDAMRTAGPNTTVEYGLTLQNTGATTDTFDLVIGDSTQNWATALYLGAALIASDNDGEGVWNWVAPAYDTNGDGNPDFGLQTGASQFLILRKTVPSAVGEVVDTTSLAATSRGNALVSDDVILTTSTVTGVQRKQLHLLENGVNDTLRTRPGSANATLTLATGTFHTWAQSPGFASAFDLRQGPLTVNFYVSSETNPWVRVTVYSGTISSPLGSSEQTSFSGPGWYTFTIANPNAIIPAGGLFLVRIENFRGGKSPLHAAL